MYVEDKSYSIIFTMDRKEEFDLGEYYKDLHLNKNILFLYANRLLIQIGTGLLAVFTAVFFYQKFNDSFTAVAIIFALMYGVFTVLIPLSAMLIERIGIRLMMIISVLFLPIGILSLVFWDRNPIVSLSMYIVLVSLYRLLYWTPYHIDFAKFTSRKDRGKQMSLLLNISSIILALTPILAGIVISLYGFNILFISSAIFFASSVAPLLHIKRTTETFSFGYFETFRELFSKKNRSLLVAYFGDGIQGAVQVVIWPIFIFILFNGEYTSVGFVTSLTIGILIFIRFIIGTMEDKFDRKKMLKFGVFFSTTGWIFKIFIETGVQVLVVDTYHRLGRAVNRMTFDVTTYDQMADSGHYIDEFTVLKEIALNGGRVVMLLLSIWLVSQFDLYITFLVAALATLLMTLLNRRVSL